MPPKRRYQIALCMIALAAILVLLLATRWGIATSQDSARYLRSARDIRESRSIAAMLAAAAQDGHFPPGYSVALAVASLAGPDPQVAARWLHALLLAANAVIAAELVRHFTGSWFAALATATVSALSFPSLYIHVLALSEPLFIFFALLSLALLASHIRRPRWALLIASAVLAGLGVMTRYAGWSTVGAAVLCLMLLPQRSVGRRVIETLIFAIAAAALPLAWSIRNQLVLGSATNRVIAWHPVNRQHLEGAAQSAWNWIATDKTESLPLTIPAMIIAIAVFVLPVLWNRRPSRAAGEAGGEQHVMLPAVMAIFALSFAALLTVSISLFDAYTPMDIRILSPVYAALLIAAGCLVAVGDRQVGRARTITWVAAIAFACWSVGRGADFAIEQFREGGGFANEQWRNSPTVASAKQLVPRDKRIYTNAPGATYLLTAHPMIAPVPVAYDASSGRNNPGHTAAFKRMRDELRSGRAVLVYLNRYGRRRPRYPTERQLQAELELQPLAKFDDGGVYVHASRPPASSRRVGSGD